MVKKSGNFHKGGGGLNPGRMSITKWLFTLRLPLVIWEVNITLKNSPKSYLDNIARYMKLVKPNTPITLYSLVIFSKPAPKDLK